MTARTARQTTRRTPGALLALTGLLAATALGVAGTTTVAHAQPAARVSAAASPKASTTTASGRVIVVLRSQTRAVELRGSATTRSSTATAKASQSKVAQAIRSGGGTVRSSYSLVNALAATVSASQAQRLAVRADVAAVIPDARIRLDPRVDPPADPDLDARAGVTPAANTCPATADGVQLEPEALAVTRANSDQPGAKTARSLGYTGAGVKVAFMAEGIDIDNPDFQRDGHSVFVDYQDFSGDGPDAVTDGAEAFLDASAIAAQGNQTYDVSHFSKLPLDRPCKIRVEGEAPGVDMVGLKVFANGFSTTSGFLDAIQYAVSTHVDVLNQSFGSNPLPDSSQDVVRAADQAAVAAGTTVVVSSGDGGITNTIGSPSTDPSVISVGGTTTYRFDLQTGYAAARFPGITGWLDDNISSLSSAGFSQTGGTQNLVAPGELNYAVCSTDLDTYEGCADYAGAPLGLIASGGTSESAPIVAGIAALVIEAYQQGHSGAKPTPFQVKAILTSSTDDISAPAQQQGAGLVDAYKAVLLAKSVGVHTSTGPAVIANKQQLQATAKPGTTTTFTTNLRNESATPQVVGLRSRVLGAYTGLSSGTVTLSDDDSPKYVDFQALPDNYGKLSFTVPAGVDRLSSSIAYQAASAALSARVRLTLVDPNGKLAAYSVPQGIGNYGHVEVAKPTAGAWTAIITSRTTAGGGTEGPVKFAVSTASFKSYGTVSPSSLTLAPGQTGTVTLKASNGATPGDTDGSLLITSSPIGGADPVAGAPDALADTSTSTIPVVQRAVIPAGSQSFKQTLTGGNGRPGYGVLFPYTIQVPAGTPELNASVQLPEDPDNQFQAALVSPGGNITAFASNVLLTTSAAGGQTQRLVKGLQLHTLAPHAGTWTLLVNFTPVVSGNNISTPFTVATSDTLVKATSTLPNSTKTVLHVGKKVTAQVTIRNAGPTPAAYFLDPRLGSETTYKLSALTGSTATAPPTDNVPTYVVPTLTSRFAATAKTTAGKPIEFDVSGPLGDPDIQSSVGTSAVARYAGSPVSQGAWFIVPSQVGPFPAGGVAPVPVDTTLSVRTATFDTTAKPSSGDLWQVSLDPDAELNPVTVPAGATAVISVDITPTKAGVVRGTMYVGDANLVASLSGSTFTQPNGDQVASVPYLYTVKP